jgi:hypothetical protein
MAGDVRWMVSYRLKTSNYSQPKSKSASHVNLNSDTFLSTGVTRNCLHGREALHEKEYIHKILCNLFIKTSISGSKFNAGRFHSLAICRPANVQTSQIHCPK